MTLLVFSAMKDEGPDVLEWACYHRVIGFDEVLVYTNDCTDGSDDLLDALQSIGLVHHRRHSTVRQDLAPQDAAARLIIDDPVFLRADWAIWVDADEFLQPLTVPDVPSLVAALDERRADAIALPWKNFGSSGHVEVPEGLVIESFNMTSGQLTRIERTFKCLFRRSAPIGQLFAHRPIWTQDGIRCLGPNLDPLPEGLSARIKENGRPDEMLPRDMKNLPRIAQINHYPVKSLRQFLLKRTRKSGLGNKGRFTDSYLNRFDINEVEQTGIHRFVPEVKTMMAEALSHPLVEEAFAEAVRRRSERVSRTDPAQIVRGA